MALYDIPLHTLSGEPTTLAEHEGKAILVVNVASKCGLTPQYTALETLQKEKGGDGFTVLGFPCNQFAGQEPGTALEIAEFCSSTYGVTFPIYEKIDVNGANRHPIYQQLVDTPDADGHSGDVRWNFEKFLISPSGEVVGRYNPTVAPDDPDLVAAIDAQIPS